MEHGGDWAGFESEYGREAIDFSMNVNPLGVPEAVAKAIAGGALRADRYPDPECRRLRAALAAHEGVPEEWIFCGNGAADIIDRIALAFGDGRAEDQCAGRALVTAPTFSEYENALERCDWEVDHLRLDEAEDFRIGRRAVEIIKMWAGEILFLCEPNNPTGLTTDMGMIRDILEHCESSGTIMVVDECFNGFLDDPEGHTVKGYLEEHPNLIVLRAFTKLYGMAGVRLGYCLCSDWKKLESIRKAGQPWNVSYLAEEAGIAALGENGYLEETRELIGRERAWLKEQLADLGIEKIYGEANYILFRCDKGDGSLCHVDAEAGPVLTERLRRQGILIRDCGNYEGLGEGWYRIAVRKHEENERLIESLEEYAHGK